MNREPPESREADAAWRTDDLLDRNAPRRYDTPRQYEREAEDDRGEPGDESTVKSKI